MRQAVGKAASLSHDAFDADENLRLALIRPVQVIGEAGRRVSADFSAQHPEIPWQEIVGRRHKVVHDYLGVDEDIVWQVVTEDLPPPVVLLEKILSTASGSIAW
ncbi:MAG TPA: HepT-like ribonuclease domain-containing protein [Vicinamibacterales bacterium]